MLAAGVNVAVGTDSRATSPDLNPVADLRLLRAKFPQTPAATLWEMVTLNAARAIGTDQVGRLAVGSHADAVAFAVNSSSADPLAAVLEEDRPPTHVWARGRSVLQS